MPDDAAATREPGADPSPTDGGQPGAVTDPAAAPAADGGAPAAPPEGGQPADAPAVPVVGSPAAQEGDEPGTEDHDWEKRYKDSQAEGVRLNATVTALRDKGLVDEEGNPVEPAPAEPAQPAQPQRQAPYDASGELYSTYHPDNVGMNAHLDYYRSQFGEIATDEYKRQIRESQYGRTAQPAPQAGLSTEQVQGMIDQSWERGRTEQKTRDTAFKAQIDQIGKEFNGVGLDGKPLPDFLDETVQVANGPEVTRRVWLESLSNDYGISPQQALYEYDNRSVHARVRELERVGALEDIQRESETAGGPAVRPAMQVVEFDQGEGKRLNAMDIPTEPRWTGPGKDQLTRI